MTQPPRDADWLLGLAKLRAQQIIKLVEMFDDGAMRREDMLNEVVRECRAILNDEEPAA